MSVPHVILHADETNDVTRMADVLLVIIGRGNAELDLTTQFKIDSGGQLS